MSKKIIVLFAEGDTDKEFYDKLLTHLETKNNTKEHCKYEIKQIKGIGNFKGKALRVFENYIISKYPGYNYEIMLCRDTDVEDFSANPPINWSEVKKKLRTLGASRVHEIKAKSSIEDWFLYDLDGLSTFLRLNKKIKKNKYKGLKGLQELFRSAGKMYSKGTRCKGLVDSLNIDLILSHICPEIQVICKAFSIDCGNEKKCKKIEGGKNNSKKNDRKKQ